MNAIKNLLKQFYDWVKYETGSLDTVIFVLPAVIVITLTYWLIRRTWHKRKFGKDFKAKRRQCRLNETIRLLSVCWLSFISTFVLMPYDFWWKFWKTAAYGKWEARPDPYSFDWNVKPLFVWLIADKYILAQVKQYIFLKTSLCLCRSDWRFRLYGSVPVSLRHFLPDLYSPL